MDTYIYNEDMPFTYSSTTATGPYFENYFVGADTGSTTDNAAIGYVTSGSSSGIGYVTSGSSSGDDWQWVNIGPDWPEAFNNNETLKFYKLMEDYASTDNGVEWKLPTPFSWFDILDIED